MPRISALDTITAPDDADQLPINDVSAITTKKMTLAGLVAWLQTKVGYIITNMIASAAVTTPKMKPTVINWMATSSGGTVVTTSTSAVDVPGASTTYTSGATAERLILEFACMHIHSGSAGHIVASINGVNMPDELGYNGTGAWQRQTKTYIADIPANTTVTLKFRYWTEGGSSSCTVHMNDIYRPTIRGFAISNV